MNKFSELLVFGEMLFDCFPTGEQVLGGAPFNVAWHLQALGDRPRMISRVGDDPLGRKILTAMADWGMDTGAVPIDFVHPTGRVDVRLVNDEPSYDIVPDCAYDFIDAATLTVPGNGGILYHGTLGLRNAVSRNAFAVLTRNPNLSIFLDVNLRAPWWRPAEVYSCLERARWAKLNREELRLLGFASDDLEKEISRMRQRFQLEQVILTQGAAGAVVGTSDDEFYHVVPQPIPHLVDTVGAGDAFSAVYIHGLRAGWEIAQILEVAQDFAGRVIGLRGATTNDPDFYREFVEAFLTDFPFKKGSRGD